MVPADMNSRETWRPTGWRPSDIAVAARSNSKKRRLEDYLREQQPAAISEERWRELVALLAPISESYLRDLLQATGIPIAQPMGGVRQGSFEDLEASLLELENEYAMAVARGD